MLLRITSPYLRSNCDTTVMSKIFERHLGDPRPWTEVAAIRIRGCRGHPRSSPSHPRSSPSHPPLTPIAHNSTLIDALFGRRRATSFESRGLLFSVAAQLKKNARFEVARLLPKTRRVLLLVKFFPTISLPLRPRILREGGVISPHTPSRVSGRGSPS